MIELQGVTKVFHQGLPNEFRAVDGVDLTIEPNRITVLRGPSGSGKTTLLSMIGCLARPTAGRILLHGRNLSGLPERFLTEVRRQTFGFTFQRFNLIQGLSVLDNVMLPAYPLAPDHAELVLRVQGLLARFGLATKAHARVEWLSGGEAQRTAICRALINDPEVLIADEPTANLDSRLTQDFLTLLEGLRADGRTLILSSHDAEVFEAPCVDRVVTLRDGAVVES
jgi:putative ABC transport system ATP-binding protein